MIFKRFISEINDEKRAQSRVIYLFDLNHFGNTDLLFYAFCLHAPSTLAVAENECESIIKEAGAEMNINQKLDPIRKG